MLAALVGCTSGERALRLGTTHTVEQSGALALLDSLAPPVTIATVIGPSGQMLHAGARGDLDVVLTHAPSLEARLLVQPGQAALRCPFVVSRFAVVGPPDDPAGVRGAPSAADALRRIARRGVFFVSRGDSSGTHTRELELWAAAGLSPRDSAWYIESGTDQAATLTLADERRAYALADLPTVARLPRLGLGPLLADDNALANPYTLYVTRGSARRADAERFVAWALESWRPRLITLTLPDGTPAFTPAAGGCSAPEHAPALEERAMLSDDLNPVARLWLERHGKYVLGEREAALLTGIDRSRSIKEAAKAAGVSYRTAWACLQAMEQTLERPVVRSRAGGLGGGQTTLTDETRALLRIFSDLSERIAQVVEREFRTAIPGVR
ncbi:MAG TPA: substrate-binding domain-containing protein [Gemmatimonadales bacterium]